MNKIEEGLHKVHALSRSGTDDSTAATTSDIQDNVHQEPFLRVNLVSSGSPAELAVRYTGCNMDEPLNCASVFKMLL